MTTKTVDLRFEISVNRPGPHIEEIARFYVKRNLPDGGRIVELDVGTFMPEHRGDLTDQVHWLVDVHARVVYDVKEVDPAVGDDMTGWGPPEKEPAKADAS